MFLKKLFKKITGGSDSDDSSQQNQNRQRQWAPNNLVPDGRGAALDQSNFADDDDVIQWSKDKKKDTSKTTDDTEEPPLKVVFSSMYDPINMSKLRKELPCMISLKATDKVGKEGEDENRPPVDIICVIDTSGSMSGLPLEMVKDTIELIIESLADGDRLCLVQFASQSRRLSSLRRTTADGKKELSDIASALYASGGTNISAGVDTAFKVIKERKNANPITSILLLSDGQDNHGDAAGRVKSSIRSMDLPDSFTINSFGYGTNHDADTLSQIAYAKDGVFHFIQEMDTVYDAFADCLGSLLTTVASDVKVRIEAIKSSTFPKLAVSNVFMDPKWVKKVNRDPARYEVGYKQILAATSKEVVFTLDTGSKAKSDKDLGAITEEEDGKQEEEGEEEEAKKGDACKVVRIVCEYTAVNQDGGRHTITEDFTVDTFTGSFWKNGEPKNHNVLKEYYRVKVAETIREAQRLAEDKSLDQARSRLDELKTEITGSEVKNESSIKLLVKDLEDCKSRMVTQSDYENVGKAWCTTVGTSHYAQESTISTAQYMNRGQERFRSGFAAKKKY